MYIYIIDNTYTAWGLSLHFPAETQGKCPNLSRLPLRLTQGPHLQNAKGVETWRKTMDHLSKKTAQSGPVVTCCYPKKLCFLWPKNRKAKENKRRRFNRKPWRICMMNTRNNQNPLTQTPFAIKRCRPAHATGVETRRAPFFCFADSAQDPSLRVPCQDSNWDTPRKSYTGSVTIAPICEHQHVFNGDPRFWRIPLVD